MYPCAYISCCWITNVWKSLPKQCTHLKNHWCHNAFALYDTEISKCNTIKQHISSSLSMRYIGKLLQHNQRFERFKGHNSYRVKWHNIRANDTSPLCCCCCCWSRRSVCDVAAVVIFCAFSIFARFSSSTLMPASSYALRFIWLLIWELQVSKEVGCSIIAHGNFKFFYIGKLACMKCT